MNIGINVILAIESSCDETAVAIVGADKTIYAQAIYSQIAEHQPYGGVVPEIAARQHSLHIDGLIASALQQANMVLGDIDAIAVTQGPGLIGGVIVGVMMAKSMACVLGIPLYGINHLQGHALSVRLCAKGLCSEVDFPYLLFLMSGGHCQIMLVKGVDDYVPIGASLDDAIGEAFDKTAKMMGLSYPGGPAIEQLAKYGDAQRFAFPRPYLDRAGCNMSFSGLKTAVRTCLLELDANEGGVNPQDKADIAASLQHTLGVIVANRLRKAGEICLNAGDDFTAMVVAGGVAANLHIRAELQNVANDFLKPFIAPPIALCTDNAAMIAWAAHEHIAAGFAPSPLELEPKARMPLIIKV